MKKYLIVSIIFLIIGCKSQKEEVTPLYKSDAYTLFRDKIKQGTNEAFVISSNEIKSNYKNSESPEFMDCIRYYLFSYFGSSALSLSE